MVIPSDRRVATLVVGGVGRRGGGFFETGEGESVIVITSLAEELPISGLGLRGGAMLLLAICTSVWLIKLRALGGCVVDVDMRGVEVRGGGACR